MLRLGHFVFAQTLLDGLRAKEEGIEAGGLRPILGVAASLGEVAEAEVFRLVFGHEGFEVVVVGGGEVVEAEKNETVGGDLGLVVGGHLEVVVLKKKAAEETLEESLPLWGVDHGLSFLFKGTVPFQRLTTWRNRKALSRFINRLRNKVLAITARLRHNGRGTYGRPPYAFTFDATNRSGWGWRGQEDSA